MAITLLYVHSLRTGVGDGMDTHIDFQLLASLLHDAPSHTNQTFIIHREVILASILVLPKPHANLTILKAYEVDVEAH
jgi:hypothetical protein